MQPPQTDAAPLHEDDDGSLRDFLTSLTAVVATAASAIQVGLEPSSCLWSTSYIAVQGSCAFSNPQECSRVQSMLTALL